MTMITPSYLGETIEYSSLHACRSTLEDPTAIRIVPVERHGRNADGRCHPPHGHALGSFLIQQPACRACDLLCCVAVMSTLYTNKVYGVGYETPGHIVPIEVGAGRQRRRHRGLNSRRDEIKGTLLGAGRG